MVYKIRTMYICFFFSSRRRHTRYWRDWSSDVCSSDLATPISFDQLQPGDLVFWGAPAYHVGIYIGDGQYIHAPTPGQVVSVGYTTWDPFTGAGRISA